MNKIIIANWKMNLVDLSEWKNFSSSKTKVVICPSFAQLEEVKEKLPSFVLGAQDVFGEERGARTGEVSLQMLKKAGAEYVIVGHSERRYIMAETDEMINKKLKLSLKAGLKPILCVGEKERESLEQTEEFVKSQLEKDIVSLREMSRRDKNLTVAYEPVWAISDSGGTADKPEESLEVIRFIRKWLEEKDLQNVRTIYGGSVDEKNIESFVKYPEIQGALVGSASLNPVSFRKIIEIAEKYS